MPGKAEVAEVITLGAKNVKWCVHYSGFLMPGKAEVAEVITLGAKNVKWCVHYSGFLMPGKAEVTAVWYPDGTKEKKQKRNLVMTLSKAYAVFEEENSGLVNFSKFAELMPVHIQLV